MLIIELNNLIEAVCPISGCNTNGDIWFKPEATTEQRAAAQALMDAHIGELE